MDILFVVMPFADLHQPSLGVSLLHAALTERGFTSQVRYFTFRLAEQIGAEFYSNCCSNFGSTLFAGDWLFAEALFAANAPPAADFVNGALALHRKLDDPEADLRRFAGKRFAQYLEDNIMPRMLMARRECSLLADEAADEILKTAPAVAAFTVGSQQLCAALAVARRLKETPDPPLILFGGASCFGEMGLQILRSFPWVDHVCTGEGELAVPEFMDRLLRKGSSVPPPGILTRAYPELTFPPLTTELDKLPLPDFHDYLEQLYLSPLHQAVADRVLFPFETSRGCWWGERSPCGFCGNHPLMQTFRSKSSEHVWDEMQKVIETYNPNRLLFTDDILEPDYFRSLFPLMAAGDQHLPFFCESKVNLTRAELKQLRNAGCDMVQFGIETMSNRLLALLPKGATTSHAIQSLRWTQELGMNASWNFLYGIAGEQPDDYSLMAGLLPLLAHLPPPLGCVRIALKRFSPYYLNPQKFGMSNLRPVSGYEYIFPLSPEEIEGLAYYFEGEYPAGDALDYIQPLRRLVGKWIAYWAGSPDERPSLDMYRTGSSSFMVIDTRPSAVQPVHRLEGITAEVYIRCDQARSIRSLAEDFSGAVREEKIVEIMGLLLNARLLWQDGDRFLALALFRNRGDENNGGGY